MNPDLRKVHDSPDELRFGHLHWKGWIVFLLGAALGAGGAYASEGVLAWVLLAFGILYGMLGLMSALYRMELVLDFMRRRYRWRRGYLHSVEEGGGPFDDIREVVLERELDRHGSVDEWEVNLVLDEWDRPVEVAESEDETSAREEATSLASRLDVPLREVTDA